MNVNRRLTRARLLLIILGSVAVSVAATFIGATAIEDSENIHITDDAIFLGVCALLVATALWITVRLINRRQRWTPPMKWTAIALGVSVLYAASFGPACWLSEYDMLDGHDVWLAYRPITWLSVCGPGPVRRALREWAELIRPFWCSIPPTPIVLERRVQYPGVLFL